MSRKKVLQVRMTVGEYADCEERAKVAGLSLSDWARRELLLPGDDKGSGSVPRRPSGPRPTGVPVRQNPPRPTTIPIKSLLEPATVRVLADLKKRGAVGKKPPCPRCARVGLAECGRSCPNRGPS